MPKNNVLTRNQVRAKIAYNLVSSPEAKGDKDYPKLAKKFPALVHTCGLAQAIAFVRAKEGDTGTVYLNHLSSVMGRSRNDLEERSHSALLPEYQRLSLEAIESASWIKRSRRSAVKGERAMTAACREGILNLWKQNEAEPTDSYELPGCANASLVMDKYLRVPVREDEHKKNARRELHQAVQESIDRSEEVYKAAFDRYKNSTPGPCKAGDCKTVEGLRLIIGIGNENVLETGLTLHHTYGTPIIPGTALKGLASHYCDQVWGAGDGKFKRGEEYHRAIFGTSDDSGHFIFHDAWITPETMKRSLRRDVMTPHHMEYYSGEDKGQAAPTDFDDPNPVTFLSVAGTFHVAVSCDVPGAEGDKWADLAFRLLTDALREWGSAERPVQDTAG